MEEEPDVRVYPSGLSDEVSELDGLLNGPPTVVITHRGCRLVLRFAPGDVSGEGPVQELRLLPDIDKLEPRVLRRFAPRAEVYLAYARAAMRIFDVSRETRRDDFLNAAETLRTIGGPGRGLSDQFYRNVAEHHATLIDEGEPHPIKTIGEAHNATISAASRWVKEARRRGYIREKGAKTDAS